MKLVHMEYPFYIEFEENKANILSIENTNVFTKVLKSFMEQTEGKEGDFVLSEGIKELRMDKKADLILSPLVVDINQKKIINKISSVLNTAAQNEMTVETMELNGAVQKYLSCLAEYSPFDVDFKDDIDIAGLLKLYEMHIPSEDMSVSENLLLYIKAMHRVCGTEVFAILNLKQYISKEELQQFYASVFYEKVFLLLIEGNFSGKEKNEKCLIYDKDCCIIEA